VARSVVVAVRELSRQVATAQAVSQLVRQRRNFWRRSGHQWERASSMTVKDKKEDFSFLFNKPREISGAGVADRVTAERAAMKPNAARRLRSSGRTEQLNLRVTRAFKEELYALSLKTGLTLGVLVERGVKKLKSELA
jgi:hypothetical protein